MAVVGGGRSGEIAQELEDGWFEATDVEGDFVVYMVVYCTAAVIDLIFIINILRDRRLRQCHGNWFPLAAVISMFINMVLLMTELIGKETDATSWNNITTVLCPTLFTLTSITQNWPSAYIIITIIGQLSRYKKGDPKSPAFPASRAIMNMCSTTVIVAAITVIVIFAVGDGISVEAVPNHDKEQCFIELTKGISDAQAGFHAFMLCFMLTTSSLLIHYKRRYHASTHTTSSLDNSVALLVATAIWFSLFLPFIIVAAVGGPTMSADMFKHYQATNLAFCCSFGITPLIWLILDPDYRRGLSNLCCPCCPDKADDPELRGLLATHSGE